MTSPHAQLTAGNKGEGLRGRRAGREELHSQWPRGFNSIRKRLLGIISRDGSCRWSSRFGPATLTFQMEARKTSAGGSGRTKRAPKRAPVSRNRREAGSERRCRSPLHLIKSRPVEAEDGRLLTHAAPASSSRSNWSSPAPTGVLPSARFRPTSSGLKKPHVRLVSDNWPSDAASTRD